MKYFRVKFRLSPYIQDAADVLASCLADIGFDTFETVDECLMGYVQQSVFREEKVKDLTRNFLFSDIDIDFLAVEMPDEDWNQTWEEEGFEPVVIDDLVCIHDTRHADVPPCRYDILINPRMAFGTGTHPTTRQILNHIALEDLKGKRVIDAGCGTGVLGILAARREAQEVFAYDIDPWSVENTQINAILNNVNVLTAKEGDASVLPQDGRYDLLIANINRNILMADMPRFANALKADGQLLFSGFYETDIPLLCKRGESFGFGLRESSVLDGWAILLLERLG